MQFSSSPNLGQNISGLYVIDFDTSFPYVINVVLSKDFSEQVSTPIPGGVT